MFRFIAVPLPFQASDVSGVRSLACFLPSSAFLFLPDINSGIRVPMGGRSDTVIPLYPHADVPEPADHRTAMMKIRYRDPERSVFSDGFRS